ncbi:MAG TPA: S1 RNA-binding domain-containing protein [Anaerolineales bacterium]|nr:S1 RNA-binding domain-containing protein [Anaerolineales bacterium]
MSDQKNSHQNKMPLVDENWWESVLADEVKITSHHRQMDVEVADQSDKSQDGTNKNSVQVDWDLAREYFKSDRIIELQVTGHNRGGLLIGGDDLAGFIPYSHLVKLASQDLGDNHDINLEEYNGKTLRVKIIECKPDEDRIVFSERAALSEAGKRIELFDSLEPGAQVSGIVTNITDFGVFVDLGGVEGLIHISELSWGRVSHPKHIVRLNDEVDVKVLEVSAERCRVALSRKRLLPNPWQKAANEFPEGKVVSATISNVLSYGAFANLDIGVEGLIHVTEMPLQEGQSPRDILSDGQRVELRILHMDAGRQRLGFSMILENE